MTMGNCNSEANTGEPRPRLDVVEGSNKEGPEFHSATTATAVAIATAPTNGCRPIAQFFLLIAASAAQGRCTPVQIPSEARESVVARLSTVPENASSTPS
jgi:hypothetical protein